MQKRKMKSIFLLIFNFCVMCKVVDCLGNVDDKASTMDDASSFNTLISSECKVNCLALYPWNRLTRRLSARQHQHQHHVGHQNDGAIKWHKVMELCAKNTMCLQCSLPCDIPKYLLTNCTYLCKGRHSSCIDSCNHLSVLNANKYGQCSGFDDLDYSDAHIDKDHWPVGKRLSSDSSTIEFSSNTGDYCTRDSDCADIQKCCDNRCQMPFINDKNLPQSPHNLTITERKKGKTVILQWESDYDKSKPTIFVVEGKWSLNYNNDDMTKWGYLAQTVNNNWIILRSIHRGRYYKFRVAAVSQSGTYGYSVPTDLFRLSAPPKPPSQPENLTLTTTDPYRLINATHVNVRVNWLPSKSSDLPVTNYKLVWYSVDMTKEPLHVNDPNQLDTIDDENDNEKELDDEEDPSRHQQSTSNPNHQDHNEILIDSNQHQWELTGLKRNLTYAVDLYALSKYNTKLSSQPVKLKLNLNEMLRNVQATSASLVQLGNFTMDKIYFQNGLVKARLKWSLLSDVATTGSPNSNLTYSLTWFPIKCHLNDNQIAPISAQTNKLAYEIYELMYDCDYVVNLRISDVKAKLSTVQIKIPKCVDIEIVGKLKPFCELTGVQKTASTIVATSSSSSSNSSSSNIGLEPLSKVDDLKYRIKNRNPKLNVFDVDFEWQTPALNDFDSKILGYQINIRNLNRTMNDTVSSLINKDQRHFHAKSLRFSTSYLFSIQLVDRSTLNLGPISTIEILVESQRDLAKQQQQSSILSATNKKVFKQITSQKTRLNPPSVSLTQQPLQPPAQPLPSLLNKDNTMAYGSPSSYILANSSPGFQFSFNFIIFILNCIFLHLYIFIF